MSDNCTESCKSCGSDCAERKEKQTDFIVKPNKLSSIKKVYAVISGKGGVGKSAVTSMIAVAMNRKGYKTAIIDADVTGPSIPKAFGVQGMVTGNKDGIIPNKSKTGIEIMSINFLLENETDPVVWRGPLISGAVKQFWTDVIWDNIDYMFIDMPPGTGDVALTVFQSISIDGIIIVTSPQELVSMIVSKAVNMAKMMNIPITGLVENMSYFKCPDCDSEYKLFGESNIDKISDLHNIPILAKLPVDSRIAIACDRGEIESINVDWFDNLTSILEKNK